MILSIGLRTDVIQNYSEWMFRRFDAGEVYVRNPLFVNKVTRYELTPDRIDAIFFRSMDYSPAMSRIGSLADSYRSLFHFVINGYGRDLEPNLAPIEDRLETLKSLSKLVGKERIYWRYDPVFITDTYHIRWHIERFAELAEQIAPYVVGCIVNFPDTFSRIHARVPSLMRASPYQKRTILEGMKQHCTKLSLPLRLCGMSELGLTLGVEQGGCVTLSDIAAANHCQFKDIPHRGNRRACSCIECRDIGWYDCCPSGCAYCVFNRDDKLTAENLKRHDPLSPLLIGSLQPDDIILTSPQLSYLTESSLQMTLFDL